MKKDDVPGKAKPLVRHQYRIRWKREGLKEKKKLYVMKRYADRFVGILGPEPWVALGKDPDEAVCCDGYMCGCGGQTWREHLLGERKDMPSIEYIKIDHRILTLGAWESNAELRGDCPGKKIV